MFRIKHGKVHNLSVPTEKELENDKKDSTRFVDSIRFLASSPSNLVDNRAKGLRNSKCKNCKFCLEYINLRINV